MMRGRSRLVAGLLLAAAAMAGPALAQQPDQSALRQFCTGDYMRLCSMYDPASPQVQQCFGEKMSQLSPGCRNAITEYTKAEERGGRRR